MLTDGYPRNLWCPNVMTTSSSMMHIFITTKTYKNKSASSICTKPDLTNRNNQPMLSECALEKTCSRILGCSPTNNTLIGCLLGCLVSWLIAWLVFTVPLPFRWRDGATWAGVKLLIEPRNHLCQPPKHQDHMINQHVHHGTNIPH